MISRLLILSAIFFSTIAAQNPELIAKLIQAPTSVERSKLLSDGDFKFDFVNAKSGKTVGAGGFSSSADVLTMPATIGNDISITVGYLGACSFDTPHLHPRSSEFNYVINGSLITGFIGENGARFIYNEVKANQAALFPMGAIHFEYNNNCEPVTFVAGFRDSFPGVTQLAQRFHDLPSDVLAAALGINQADIQKFFGSVPDNIALAMEECTKRCGINRANQPTQQLSNTTKSNINTAGDDGVKGNLDNGESNRSNGLIIGLGVAIGVMALGLIALAAFVVLRRNKSRKGAPRDYVRTGESFAPGGMYDSEKYEFPSETLRTPYDPPSGSH